MKRRMITTLLTAMMAVSIAATGCGSTSTSENTGAAVAAESTSTTGEADESSTEESTEASDSDATETEESVSDDTTADGLMVDINDLDLTSMFTERDQDASYEETAGTANFSAEGADVTGSGISVEGSIVTITEEGTYVISGETSDGQIIVAAEDTAKVQLVLANASITNDDGPAILVKSADKVFITLEDGTTNTLADTGAEYTQLDDVDSTIDGVIYADCDLTLNGSGTLVLNAQTANGIVSKDDLKITDGTYEITAVGKGIQANDSIRIAGGVIDVDSEDDAIHTSKEDEEGKGYIYIAGGSLTLASGDDGIHAATALIIEDGSVTVTESYEGLEGDTIDILGGDIDVTASDDGFNASRSSNQDTNNEALEGGEMAGQAPPTSGETSSETSGDAANANGEAPEPPTDGQAPEGMTEGERPEMPADGQMPSGGFGGGGGMEEADDYAYISISGGTVLVNAEGDGLDSNGYLVISGGDVTVYGPTNDGNGALDVGSTATVTGGTVTVAGSSGMAVGFDDDSTQYSIKYNFSETISAGTEVTLTDSNGNVILSFTPEKDFQNVVLSSSDLAEGSYTITAGDSSEEITVDSIATSAGTESSGMGGGPRGAGNESSAVTTDASAAAATSSNS